jgi:hypothetical protein
MQYRFCYTKEHNTFRAYYLEQYFSKDFDFHPFTIDHDLGSNDILLFSENHSVPEFQTISAATLDRAKAIVVDNLQEPRLPHIDFLLPWKHKTLILTAGAGHIESDFRLLVVPEWFWYFESLWYRSRDYHLYVPNCVVPSRLFFMPIRRRRPGRDLIYKCLQSMLDQAVYSFVERGVRLPGIPDHAIEDQRWFNPDWYDDTCFSVVCEDDDDSYPILWSEKTCKPLAFFHPFVLIAQKGLLQLLRDHGFETFPELFDESYDMLENIQKRVEAVCWQVQNARAADFRAPEILQKTKYNHERFFDRSLVEQRINDRLLLPLLEFLETVQ